MIPPAPPSPCVGVTLSQSVCCFTFSTLSKETIITHCWWHQHQHQLYKSHVTNHWKMALDPLCDTILEMSPPQHQHGAVIYVTGHVMCHITCHTSHVTNVTNHWKIALDPLCDTILEMSPPQHQHGTLINITGHIIYHITCKCNPLTGSPKGLLCF